MGTEVILRRCPICVQDSIICHGRRRPMMSTTIGFGIRRGDCNRCGKTFTFLPTLLSAVRPLQPDCPQSGSTALLSGRLFLGDRGPRRQRSRSRDRSLHAAPLVPESRLFRPAVFLFAPDHIGHRRLVRQGRERRSALAAVTLAHPISLSRPNPCGFRRTAAAHFNPYLSPHSRSRRWM